MMDNELTNQAVNLDLAKRLIASDRHHVADRVARGLIDMIASLTAERDRLREAAKKAREALTANTIGTIDMDDPDWYSQIDSAVEAIDQAISGRAEGDIQP